MKKKSKKSTRKKSTSLSYRTLFQLLIVVLLGSLAFITVRFVFAQNGHAKKTPPKIDAVSPESGALGTQLILTGSQFTPNTNDILIHGKELLTDIPSPDGTTIVFTLPLITSCQPPQACPIKVSNENGISNAVPFKIEGGGFGRENLVTVTVFTPNGGEVCVPGEYCGITWAAYQNGQLITHEVVGNKDVGLVEVKIALVRDTTTNSSDPSNLIVGWIETQPDRIAAIRDYAWYAAAIYDADGVFPINFPAGTYKILIVAQDSNGQYTLWDTNINKPGNFDVSDSSFTIPYTERQ